MARVRVFGGKFECLLSPLQAEAVVPLAMRWLAAPSLLGINGVALAALRG